ncbi:helix-turn-helix domain-containing protein, partial [Methylicorpusculum sp.]|uniref:helix-turn-helix domain-containing protein n=1 Tax=Methylicorpusculum sp. TaxID=2713644 RepID=UPI002AB91893
MSLAAMVWAMNQTTGSPQSKLVLLKLADNANSDTGVCWPSLASIARVTEMNRSTVIRHIKKLNELGLIVTIHRSHEGVNLSNHYRLLMVEPSIMSENEVTRGDCTLPLPPSERDQDDGGVQPRVVAER